MSPRPHGPGPIAPPLDLPTATGERRSLADLRGRPVLVSFLGPAHCMFCRAYVIRLIAARDELLANGAEVVLVVADDPALVMTQMLQHLDVPFALLVDRRRDAYARWGLGRAGRWAAMHPGLYWAFLTLSLRGGRNLGQPPPGPTQLGGDFVVDRRGHLILAHRLTSFYDRAPISRLVETLRRA